MINALKISLHVVSIALIFNLIFSIALYFLLIKQKNIKKIFEFIVTIPIFLPPSVIGYILIIILGRNSFIGKLFYKLFNFRFFFTIEGAIVAATIISLPIIYQSIKIAFDSIERNYIETAECLGVNWFNMIIYIYIPLTYKQILSGTILAIGRALGEFGATILIAGNIPGRTQTLPLALYSAIESNNYSEANSILFILLIFSSIFLTIYIIVTKKESH